ncbi:radical SAM protein [Candidatus Pacearchaeota archaeon]|nr:radical SAM protein [Candidatus Pacearchaeota archaeon]
MKIQTFSILAGTAACNASCPYCISKMTGKKRLIVSKINWRNFHKACRLAEVNSVSTVLITGKGEPTLYPEQITDYLIHMKKYDFPLIELQTNALLLQNDNFERYLKKWYGLGLNTLAISIVHYRNEINQRVFTPHGSYINLEAVIKRLHGLGFSIRLSCTLMKDFIDSAGEIKKLVKFAKQNSIEQLTIRKLGLMKNSENKEVEKWCRSHVLGQGEINKIIKYMDKNATKLMTLSHGAIIYELDGQNICLTDCEMIQPKTEEIRTLIFFPDGHLRWNWEFGGAILL